MRFGSSRCAPVRRGIGVLAAGALALGMAASADAAVTSYPAGGSSFASGTDGWVGSAQACGITLLVLPLPNAGLCTTTTPHDASVGNPPGSISSRTDVTLNLLSIFSGSSRWTSPEFTVPAGQVTGATVSLDRAIAPGGLLNIGLTSDYVVTLHNRTTGNTTTALEETLTTSETTFAARGAGIEITPGHTYQLTIDTATSSTIGLTLFSGATDTRFDNVALTVETAGGGGGGDGGTGGPFPVVSPGVTIVRAPYSDAEIANIIDQYGSQIGTDRGSGRDGSLIPLELCTILGTSGPDRITGSSGNDVICGLGGNDTISGVGGRDVVDGADGNDRVSGGIGGDLLLGLAGNDRLDGGADADRIGGGAGRDRIEAGNGRDVAHGGSGNDSVGGEAGPDVLRGGAGNDRINGGPGNDRLFGGAGNDVLRGFSGFDRHSGGPGNDRLLTRDGRRDVANGGPGRDRAVADRVDRIRGVERVRRG